MFIRWKRRRKTVDKWLGLLTEREVWTRYLYLCESKRIDGKPRNRVVAYLGDFEECYAHDESKKGIEERFSFWWRADQWLEDRELLNEETCKRLQAKIALVVPRPDEQALTEYKAGVERRLGIYKTVRSG